MARSFHVVPIGYVQCTRNAIRDDVWDGESSVINLDPAQFTVDALAGLNQFSHAEILYYFDQVAPERIVSGKRHPRGNTQWPQVGIFAQRAKNRPNRIGSTIVSIVTVQGLSLVVRGLDAIDGTPVLDIKPYMSEFGPRGETHQPKWSVELMRNYWSLSDQQ
jgi:tRNA-Thr(GGU) m(6)t(6)A37 methyltransferase TsaA